MVCTILCNANSVHAQGLVDSLDRLSLIVPEKMFNIFEHEGLWARLCEYSLDSKNSVPCVLSLNPCGRFKLFFLETPEIEKGWQGNPPTRMSYEGMSDAEIAWMSPFGRSPKFFW